MILDRLQIHATMHSNIWHDLVDQTFPMMAIVTLDGHKYTGMIHLIDDSANNPKLVLSGYTIDGNESRSNSVVVLDINKASEVIIKYDADSDMSQSIRVEQVDE